MRVQQPTSNMIKKSEENLRQSDLFKHRVHFREESKLQKKLACTVDIFTVTLSVPER